MYLHLGKGTVVKKTDIVAVFDLDNASYSHITRDYLAQAERKGRIFSACDDLPKSFVVVDSGSGQVIYLSQLSSSTLMSRARNAELETL
ncbi:MAG: extracellular matrix regulator RemB [Oscillospiraceae bacterium]